MHTNVFVWQNYCYKTRSKANKKDKKEGWSRTKTKTRWTCAPPHTLVGAQGPHGPHRVHAYADIFLFQTTRTLRIETRKRNILQGPATHGSLEAPFTRVCFLQGSSWSHFQGSQGMLFPEAFNTVFIRILATSGYSRHWALCPGGGWSLLHLDCAEQLFLFEP